MNRRTPGLPVHHQLLETTQTHVHRVGDAIQPFHSLSPPFSSCPQSLPASGSFPMSQLFTWGGQSTRVSASASVLPMNTQDWSPLGWTGWISLQSKGLSRVFSNTTGVAAKRSYPLTKKQWRCGCRRAERSYSMFKVRRGSHEEIPLVQGKRNPSKRVGVARRHQRADTLKP